MRLFFEKFMVKNYVILNFTQYFTIKNQITIINASKLSKKQDLFQKPQYFQIILQKQMLERI